VKENRWGGVIFNRVASTHHYERLCTAVQNVPVLGYVPRDVQFGIPHRHLGLVVAEEEPVSAASLDKLAETMLTHVDVDRLLSLSRSFPSQEPFIGPKRPMKAKKAARIAIAADRAFCFYYQDNIDLLKEAGAEILFFSPLADPGLPADIDAVYLGGGYPELYAGRLSENGSMRASVKEWADSGGSLYAECGGLMYLSRSIRDLDNVVHDMAGVFSFRTVMTRGRAHLGYREVILEKDCPLGLAARKARGHEFHYSEIVRGEAAEVDPAYRMKNGSGEDLAPEGYRRKNVLGSYVHIHFGSNPLIAGSFIEFATKGRTS
jgi:cobyrinic acid a,c-diamide synthase